MHNQLNMVTKFSSEPLLCLQKVENVISYFKRPIDLVKQ